MGISIKYRKKWKKQNTARKFWSIFLGRHLIYSSGYNYKNLLKCIKNMSTTIQLVYFCLIRTFLFFNGEEQLYGLLLLFIILNLLFTSGLLLIIII